MSAPPDRPGKPPAGGPGHRVVFQPMEQAGRCGPLIAYAAHVRRSEDGGEALQRTGVGALNDLAGAPVAETGASTREIAEVTIAGDGARTVLLSTSCRAVAADIAARVRYVELAGSEGFMPAYVGRINFPEKQRPAGRTGKAREQEVEA